MKLDFKGIITTKELTNNSEIIDKILLENDYAIIVDDGVGKYVLFNIDFVENRLKLNDDVGEPEYSYSLVESMIKALEVIPDRKSTAIYLSTLVEVYYGREASPVTIRTRAEENANQKNDVDYFYIEPNNYIGLIDNVTFDTYMMNKIRKGIKLRFDRLFRNTLKLDLRIALKEIVTMLSGKMYHDYYLNRSTGQYIDLISSINEYEVIDYDYVQIKKEFRKQYI